MIKIKWERKLKSEGKVKEHKRSNEKNNLY